MTAGLYFSHPSSLEHDPRAYSPAHPDTPERLRAIERALAGWDWGAWERREAPAASEAELELIHSARHVGAIAELCRSGLLPRRRTRRGSGLRDDAGADGR